MYEMREVICQIDPISEGLNINPYGLAVYGALVVVLGFIAYKLYGDLQKEREASKELAAQAMVLMTKLEERLPSVKEFTEMKIILQSMDDKIKIIIQTIDDKLNKMTKP